MVNDVLSSTQENGPPLAGKIESKEASKFISTSWGGAITLPRLYIQPLIVRPQEPG